MSEGQTAPERPDEAAGAAFVSAPGWGPRAAGAAEAGGPTPPRPWTADPGGVLLAIERLEADIASLGRAVAAQPEEVAARVDVEAATAPIGVRVGALGSTLDHLRLSLLAALDRTVERLDEPAWMSSLEGIIDLLAGVTRRQDELTAAITWVGDRLGEMASYVVPSDQAEQQDSDEGSDTLLDRLTELARGQDELLAAVEGSTARLDRIDLALDEVAAAAVPWGDDDRAPGGRDRSDVLLDQLTALAGRQDELLSALEGSVGDGRGPMGYAAVFDRMEQRERSLAARLDRIDLQLRQGAGGPGGGPAPAAGLGAAGADSVAASIDAIAAVTDDLEALVQATAERLERRLAGVEAAVDDAVAQRGGQRAPAPAAASSGASAARLAELRAERARIQGRLREERLLAAEDWADEP